MLSDPGLVRGHNEDACAANAEYGVFVVCDGVGGAAGRAAFDDYTARLAAAAVELSDLARTLRDEVEGWGEDDPQRLVDVQERRRLLAAVVTSSMVGLVVDSIVFLSLAFGSLEFLPGQIVGKAWAVLIAIPLVRLLRRVAPTPA